MICIHCANKEAEIERLRCEVLEITARMILEKAEFEHGKDNKRNDGGIKQAVTAS